MNEIIYTIAQTANQTSFFMEHFDTIIPVIITISGFIISYYMTKKNFKDEVIKNKLAINADIIRELPYEVCQLMDQLTNVKNPITADQYKKFYAKILAYGSKDAVSISVHMQQLCYEYPDNQNGTNMYELLAYYALLVTQIKYDLTSEIISPLCWFELKFKDYKPMKSNIIIAINNIIRKLDLNEKFIVNEK